MNMMAMSKRLMLARLLRISSVTAGASFLHKTDVNVQYETTHVTWLCLSIFQNSLGIEIMQRPQDLIENVRFKGVVENVCICFWLNLLKDEKNTRLKILFQKSNAVFNSKSDSS